MVRMVVAGFGGVFAFAAQAGEPQYFIRDVGSLADCHREYTALAGSWQSRPTFMLRKTANGGEHAVNCLVDGVAEYVCNPVGGKLAVAVMQGATSPACKRYAGPHVPATATKALIPVD